ncbi:hypothetical protein EH223_18900 [candidate division KSB1 bacterium]|nr:hypothetical protein [candidate division KSB1 bacterium]RQW00372.1 MAG: hypothetical protein EH223_18900 [candidate division KSB1 bacterium]
MTSILKSFFEKFTPIFGLIAGLTTIATLVLGVVYIKDYHLVALFVFIIFGFLSILLITSWALKKPTTQVGFNLNKKNNNRIIKLVIASILSLLIILTIIIVLNISIALVQFANFCESTNQLKLAKSALKHSLTINPNLPRVPRRLAQLHMKDENWDEARHLLTDIETQQDSVTVELLIDTWLLDNSIGLEEKYEKTGQLFEQLLQSSISNQYRAKILQRYASRDMLFHPPDEIYDNPINLLRRSLQLGPNDITSRLLLAYYLSISKEHQALVEIELAEDKIKEILNQTKAEEIIEDASILVLKLYKLPYFKCRVLTNLEMYNKADSLYDSAIRQIVHSPELDFEPIGEMHHATDIYNTRGYTLGSSKINMIRELTYHWISNNSLGNLGIDKIKKFYAESSDLSSLLKKANKLESSIILSGFVFKENPDGIAIVLLDLLHEGIKLLDAGNEKKAQEYFNTISYFSKHWGESLHSDPLIFISALAFYNLNDFENAKPYFEMILDSYPDNAMLNFHYGRTIHNTEVISLSDGTSKRAVSIDEFLDFLSSGKNENVSFNGDALIKVLTRYRKAHQLDPNSYKYAHQLFRLEWICFSMFYNQMGHDKFLSIMGIDVPSDLIASIDNALKVADTRANAKDIQELKEYRAMLLDQS